MLPRDIGRNFVGVSNVSDIRALHVQNFEAMPTLGVLTEVSLDFVLLEWS